MLFGCLLAMIVWSFIQLFFPPGPVGRTIFALLGAFLFSAYLVFDTQLLITRFDLDDYVWAAITIYLDIINLFLYILRLLGESRNN
jgi:FtsH-binding integral membrane protein